MPKDKNAKISSSDVTINGRSNHCGGTYINGEISSPAFPDHSYHCNVNNEVRRTQRDNPLNETVDSPDNSSERQKGFSQEKIPFHHKRQEAKDCNTDSQCMNSKNKASGEYKVEVDKETFNDKEFELANPHLIDKLEFGFTTSQSNQKNSTYSFSTECYSSGDDPVETRKHVTANPGLPPTERDLTKHLENDEASSSNLEYQEEILAKRNIERAVQQVEIIDANATNGILSRETRDIGPIETVSQVSSREAKTSPSQGNHPGISNDHVTDQDLKKTLDIQDQIYSENRVVLEDQLGGLHRAPGKSNAELSVQNKNQMTSLSMSNKTTEKQSDIPSHGRDCYKCCRKQCKNLVDINALPKYKRIYDRRMKEFISTWVMVKQCWSLKRSRVKTSRNCAREYTLPGAGGKPVKICKKAFMHLLELTSDNINSALKHKTAEVKVPTEQKEVKDLMEEHSDTTSKHSVENADLSNSTDPPSTNGNLSSQSSRVTCQVTENCGLLSSLQDGTSNVPYSNNNCPGGGEVNGLPTTTTCGSTWLTNKQFSASAPLSPSTLVCRVPTGVVDCSQVDLSKIDVRSNQLQDVPTQGFLVHHSWQNTGNYVQNEQQPTSISTIPVDNLSMMNNSLTSAPSLDSAVQGLLQLPLVQPTASTSNCILTTGNTEAPYIPTTVFFEGGTPGDGQAQKNTEEDDGMSAAIVPLQTPMMTPDEVDEIRHELAALGIKQSQGPHQLKDNKVDVTFIHNKLQINSKDDSQPIKGLLSSDKLRTVTDNVTPAQVHVIRTELVNLDLCFNELFSFASKCTKCKEVLIYDTIDNTSDNLGIAKGLALVLYHVHSLTEIDIRDTYLGEGGRQVLSSLSCPHQRVLTLFDDHLAGCGPQLAACLTRLPLLAYLNLNDSGLTGEEMPGVLDNLAVSCPHLVALLLDSDLSQAADALTRAVQAKSRLQVLNIAGCELESKHLLNIVKSTSLNTECLHFWGNAVCTEVETELVRLTEQRPSLRYVGMDKEQVSTGVWDRMESVLRGRGGHLHESRIGSDEYKKATAYLNNVHDECLIEET